MRAFAVFAVAALVVTGGLLETAGAAEELRIGGNVESLLGYARDHHPEFAALRLEAEAAADRVGPAGALPDPMFRTELRDITNEARGGDSSLLPSRVGSTKYTVTQNLPWFGKRDLRRDAAAAGAEEASGRARANWVELATRIKQAYAQHYVLLHTRRLLDENLDWLQRLGDIARTRYANGQGPQQDVLRVLTERSQMQGELAMLEGDDVQTNTRMRSLLGRPPAQVRLLPPAQPRSLPGAPKLDFAALETRLLANNPELAMAAARIDAADKGRELTYRNRYPDLTLGVSPIQTRSRVSEWELMFEVSIPLQQESRRAQEREAERMLEAAKLRREATLNQMLADLAEYLARLDAASRIATLVSNQVLPQAELSLQSALAGYETGKVDFAALLDAQRQVRRARQDLVKAQGDQQIRLADIERLIGEEL